MIYEVFGIVILDSQKKLFLLYDNSEVLDIYIENNNSEMYNINQKVENLKKKLWFLIIE